jgi:hypothetical protein
VQVGKGGWWYTYRFEDAVEDVFEIRPVGAEAFDLLLFCRDALALFRK